MHKPLRSLTEEGQFCCTDARLVALRDAKCLNAVNSGLYLTHWPRRLRDWTEDPLCFSLRLLVRLVLSFLAPRRRHGSADVRRLFRLGKTA